MTFQSIAESKSAAIERINGRYYAVGCYGHCVAGHCNCRAINKVKSSTKKNRVWKNICIALGYPFGNQSA